MSKRISSAIELRAALEDLRNHGQSIGFVPTMGFLHAGHGSLLTRARQDNDVVVLSIFVNPLQFNVASDFEVYPTDNKRDDALANEHGVDIIFSPSTEEMYPGGRPKTSVRVSEVTDVLEGAHRPGHFDGVALVVAKLLNIVDPTRAYFGEKDLQQLAVVRQMADDLSMACEIIGCPIVRNPDGLALSSRNSLLSTEDRRKALSLSRALDAGKEAFSSGATTPRDVIDAMRRVFEAEADVKVDYASVVDCETLREPEVLSVPFQILVAATIGNVRLIDNCRVEG